MARTLCFDEGYEFWTAYARFLSASQGFFLEAGEHLLVNLCLRPSGQVLIGRQWLDVYFKLSVVLLSNIRKSKSVIVLVSLESTRVTIHISLS